MSTNNPGLGSLGALLRPNTRATTEISTHRTPRARSQQHPSRYNLQPPTVVTSRSPSPAKRAHKEKDSDSDSQSNSDNSGDEGGEENNDNTMDFQHTEHDNAMQAIGGDIDELTSTAPQMAAPLSPEYAALRTDIKIITSNLIDQFARSMCTEISDLFAKNNTTFQNAKNSLTKQIATLGTQVTQMQQLLSATQGPAATAKPAGGPRNTSPNPKKERKRKGKGAIENNYNVNNPPTNNSTSTHTYADAAKTPTAQPNPPTEHAIHATNVEGWENLKKKTQGRKPAIAKLIPTMYPQAECEVTCHFPGASPAEAALHAKQDCITRQTITNTALHRVNKALVDNQDVTAPLFLCARVTMRGSIIFTTTNTQKNIIYEDYTMIIADALSCYGKCEKVKIGKRFSQYLLHGVLTHLSLPDISDSIATNYPQLVQC